MRLWSVHPRYLDRQGLTACWREGLLAQAVLVGATRGYTRHPQLERFRATAAPVRTIGAYLTGVHVEASARGYTFDLGRVREPGADVPTMLVTDGQLRHEWAHLVAKLQRRSPQLLDRWSAVQLPDPHPSFRVVAGPVAAWERGPAAGPRASSR
ncbi:conserved hypothetical protein [Beutenbergia cavernae DSM 12333]|uniref:Pyrimidine dimer DNA glycosylase n=1 Tax=Beutenbergia cavernae (strain ATCC BAA-8 / DSM 12333 / CCUG 43141 / JCM 11478 / NBRC 16432 / NCIMB 13614 / HKI 0122) TaxID=471853 RepID=C5C2A3_BEUC1|nr:pyrimidine dimer DNA glycosylase/endonuclease V [Beutenbergia cavernae]ACQ81728.1 conserved hypothetical protein [Beutenbergia cavernae DSM 12333]